MLKESKAVKYFGPSITTNRYKILDKNGNWGEWL
jgi:hypothetical protein